MTVPATAHTLQSTHVQRRNAARYIAGNVAHNADELRMLLDELGLTAHDGKIEPTDEENR